MANGANGDGNSGGGWGSVEPLVRIVRDVGFPIAVAGWLLWQLPALRDAVRDFATWAQQQTEVAKTQTQTLTEITRELREHRVRSEALPEWRAAKPPNGP